MIWFECSSNNVQHNRDYVYFLSEKSSRNNGFFISHSNFRRCMALSIARSNPLFTTGDWVVDANVYLSPKK